MANDPYWNSVVLAMHMDDAGLTDLKGHAVTLAGNVTRSGAQSKFGGYSAVVDGTGDYLTTPYVAADFNWWTGSFTLECWVFASSFSTWQLSDGTYLHAKLIGNSGTASYTTYWSFGPLASGAVLFRYWNGSATNAVTSTETVVSGQWNHIAVVFDGSKINIYVNGVGLATPVSVSGTPQASTSVPLALGVFNSQYLAGYVDDLRITKGVARYTANFAVPTEAFPNRPMQLSGTVKDSSGNFAARTVRAYKRSTGALSDSDTSSASDGAFTLDAADGTAHYVICFDDDLNENALIFDNLTPV